MMRHVQLSSVFLSRLKTHRLKWSHRSRQQSLVWHTIKCAYVSIPCDVGTRSYREIISSLAGTCHRFDIQSNVHPLWRGFWGHGHTTTIPRRNPGEILYFAFDRVHVLKIVFWCDFFPRQIMVAVCKPRACVYHNSCLTWVVGEGVCVYHNSWGCRYLGM